ncbi:hypothetical protein quinque_008343 [Culex quinquefasciatus]
MDELPVLMEKLRKAKNLRQLHLDLNKPGKEVISGGPSMTPDSLLQNQCESWMVVQLTQIQLDIVEIGSSDVVWTREEVCQISTSLSVTLSCIRVECGCDCLAERVGNLRYFTLRACDVRRVCGST